MSQEAIDSFNDGWSKYHICAKYIESTRCTDTRYIDTRTRYSDNYLATKSHKVTKSSLNAGMNMRNIVDTIGSITEDPPYSSPAISTFAA